MALSAEIAAAKYGEGGDDASAATTARRRLGKEDGKGTHT